MKTRNKLFSNKIIKFDSLDSTQNYAKQLAKSGKPEGTIVIAKKQTAGRGRFRQVWDSPPGGLWFSFILQPKFSAEKLSLITMISALSVLHAVKKIALLDPMIKWPNDIFVQGKKVCGIITEAGWMTDNLDWVVAGIGLNVNNQIPAALQQKAVSLSQLTDKNIALSELFLEILDQIQRYYQLLKTGEEDTVMEEVKKYSLVVNRDVLIENNHRFVSGKVINLDKDGSLVISTAKGEEKIISGEIQLIY